MGSEVNLNFDPMGFFNIMGERNAAIEEAPAAPLPADYPVNRLMRSFHPRWQYTRILDVQEHGGYARSYTLGPDTERGTEELACFSAGQYVSVYLAIGASRLLRPYTIRSTPAEAMSGIYVLTIKRMDGGLASDYILDSWQPGGRVTLSGPEGNFTYEPLRDAGEIVGIAGGSGITPFCSLAGAIADGTESCRLTLLYGSRCREKILLKEELDLIAGKTEGVRVIHILSDEAASGYERGLLSAEVIKKYAPAGDYSLFLCGPQAMYDYLEGQLQALDLPLRRIRREVSGECKNPQTRPDYPGAERGGFNMRLSIRGTIRELPCAAGESLLAALERGGIAAPSRCRSGECGFCRTRLLSGEVYIPASMDKRRLSDVTRNYIHPCVTFPLSDLSLDVPGQKDPL